MFSTKKKGKGEGSAHLPPGGGRPTTAMEQSEVRGDLPARTPKHLWSQPASAWFPR